MEDTEDMKPKRDSEGAPEYTQTQALCGMASKTKATNSHQHSQGNKAAEDEANKEAEAQIVEIKQAGKKSQDKVVAELLKAVFDVKPVAPEVS